MAGEKYRCGLLLALLGEPDFLLLDEPFAAVDADTQETIADLCLDLKRGALPFFRHGEPAGLLLITHQIEIAFQLCDRWHLLDRRAGRPYGECRWQGTPLEALAAHGAGRIAAPDLRRLLDKAQWVDAAPGEPTAVFHWRALTTGAQTLKKTP